MLSFVGRSQSRRPQDVPSSKLFNKLNWMTINEYFTSILMFKTVSKNLGLLNYLYNRFENVKDKHHINTTSAANGNLSIPKLSSKTGQRSFQYRGVNTWNSLSVDARDYKGYRMVFANMGAVRLFLRARGLKIARAFSSELFQVGLP